MMDQKIKILHCIRQGLIGGGETHVLDLVSNLNEDKFESVVLSFTDGPMIERLNHMGIKNKVIHTTKPFDFRVWSEIESYLEEIKPDLVHAHGTRAASNLLNPCKHKNIPIIYTVHGWSFHDDQKFPIKQLRVLSEKYISNRTDLNISVSKSNQETGIKNFGKYHSKVIYNGIDLGKYNPEIDSILSKEQFGIPVGCTLITCAMRMTIQKNPLTMIKAFKKATESVSNIHLLMVGDGELKKDAIELSKELELEKKITFLNFRNDVVDILKISDVYCLPSLWEGFPIGLLEAMGMGLPSIATRVDGSKELIENGENGFLVEAGDLESLSAAIIQMSKNPQLVKQFSEKSVQTVRENYSVEKMVLKIENTYETLKRKSDMTNVKMPYTYNSIRDQKRLNFIIKTLNEELPENGKVLDVGCGNGIISMHLGAKGFSVKGIDVSEKAIEKANSVNPFSNVSFENLSAEDLAAKGEKYDAIICSEVLEHLDAPGELLEKLHPSLTDKGVLIVTVPNGRGPRELLVTRPMIKIRNNKSAWKFVNKIKRALGYSGTTVQSDADNLDHIQFFTQNSIKKLSKTTGFKVVSFKNSNFVEDVFPFSLFTNKIKFLQKIDCKIADALPHSFTGGFMMIWNKN